MDIEHIDTVSERGNGLSLHDYLRGCWPYLNNECWQQLLQDSTLEIDEAPLQKTGNLNPILSAGQTLSYTLRDYREDEVDCQWKLLWQSDDIIAVHKPANLPVSRTTRNFYNTLIRLVRRESDWPDAHLLHRLDLDTSGIILLGKDKAAASYWQPKLQQLLERKVYRAVVYGQPTWQQLSFECRLGTRADSPIRCQMHVCEDHEKAKHSRTDFRVIHSNSGYSVIECELFTGRKHQIRAHLAHLGHPIVGDKIYSNSGEFYLKRLTDCDTERDHQQLQTPHHLLFAQQAQLNISRERLTDTTPNPSEQSFNKITHINEARVPPVTAITIINPHLPQEWLSFCHKVGLKPQ